MKAFLILLLLFCTSTIGYPHGIERGKKIHKELEIFIFSQIYNQYPELTKSTLSIDNIEMDESNQSNPLVYRFIFSIKSRPAIGNISMIKVFAISDSENLEDAETYKISFIELVNESNK